MSSIPIPARKKWKNDFGRSNYPGTTCNYVLLYLLPTQDKEWDDVVHGAEDEAGGAADPKAAVNGGHDVQDSDAREQGLKETNERTVGVCHIPIGDLATLYRVEDPDMKNAIEHHTCTHENCCCLFQCAIGLFHFAKSSVLFRAAATECFIGLLSLELSYLVLLLSLFTSEVFLALC